MAKEFRLYRPNKSGTGSAVAFQLAYKEANKYDPWLMFMVVAKQTGTDANENASFGWKEGAITVKLMEGDIGEIIAVLDGVQQQVGQKGMLYHQTPGGGNKIINFSAGENGYSLRVSAQNAEKQNTPPISLIISRGEGAVLSALLKQAILKMYGWE